MAVFRVEKTQNYTVMSNHHLRNKDLTLKAKGLLSQMLSLPESWDYTLRGLSSINREKIDAIRTAVLELEEAGYITRQQGRDDKGKMAAIEYTIYEQPQPSPHLDCPILENPNAVNPTSEKPITDKPTTGNPRGNCQSGVTRFKEAGDKLPDALLHLISLHCSTEHLKEAKPFVKVL